MDKIVIEKKAKSSDPLWGHLIPVVEYAQKHGCEITSSKQGNLFVGSKSGDYCYMVGSLSMQDLKEVFSFPDTIVFGSQGRGLYDTKNDITLRIRKE